VDEIDGEWRSVAGQLAHPTRIRTADEVRKLATHVRIETAKRLSKASLACRHEVQIPLRELGESVDPSTPVEVAKRLGLHLAKALDKSPREHLLMNASSLQQAGDDCIDLSRSDRLHEIRADLSAERFHERGVFLALGDHHNVEIRRDFPEFAKRIQAASSRHLLVEQHQIERTATE
jgi:hypothetical protein